MILENKLNFRKSSRVRNQFEKNQGTDIVNAKENEIVFIFRLFKESFGSELSHYLIILFSVLMGSAES